MIFREFAGFGLIVLTTILACSGGEAAPATGSGGNGGAGSSAQGGSKAQAGSAGNGGGTAGGSSAGSSMGASAGASAGGVDSGQGGEPALAGSGGVAGDTGAGGADAGEGGAAPDGGQIIEECLDAPIVAQTRTEALEFSGAGLTLAIVRRVDPDAFGTSGTTVWLPQRFGLVRADVAQCISDVQALDYTVSHHNFDDVMTASYAAETWIFSQTRQDYGFPAVFALEARSGNALVWGPVTLTLVGCQELLQDESCLTTYQE